MKRLLILLSFVFVLVFSQYTGEDKTANSVTIDPNDEGDIEVLYDPDPDMG